MVCITMELVLKTQTKHVFLLVEYETKETKAVDAEMHKLINEVIAEECKELIND